jgi:HK97 family phage major capsid protein
VIRGISRVETLTVGNVWNGVSSAGITAGWDGELVEVNDDTPNDFARVSVPLYKAASFAQASEEALADIGNVQSSLLTMFADAKDRLEAAAHATGSGSAQPTGIFTALDANSNVEIVTTTANLVDLTQLQRVYRSVPVRWRGTSTWLIHPLFLGTIQALGTAVSASYSTDITQPYTPRLLGRPVVESDEAPSTETTTAKDNVTILGDFSNFLIIDKPGSMTVTYIPVMFNTSNNLPDGRVGWRVSWRTGSDSINDVAFRLLQEKTSA